MYEPIDAALENPEIIDLSKEFIKATIETTAGLYKLSKPVMTNTKYQSYDVYLAK